MSNDAMFSAIEPANNRSSCSTQPTRTAIGRKTEGCHGNSVYQHLTGGRLGKSGQQFEQRRLARSGRSRNTKAFTRRNAETDVVQHFWLVVSIAKPDVCELERAGSFRQKALTGGGQGFPLFFLRLSQGNIGQCVLHGAKASRIAGPYR